MSELLPLFALGAACCLIIIGSSRLGPATSLVLSGLWAPQGRNDWPRGIQEMDAPHFAVTHLDGLRPGTAMAPDGPAEAGAHERDERQPEVVELFDGPLRDRPAR